MFASAWIFAAGIYYLIYDFGVSCSANCALWHLVNFSGFLHPTRMRWPRRRVWSYLRFCWVVVLPVILVQTSAPQKFNIAPQKRGWKILEDYLPIGKATFEGNVYIQQLDLFGSPPPGPKTFFGEMATVRCTSQRFGVLKSFWTFLCSCY